MNPFDTFATETIFLERGTERLGPFRAEISGTKGTCTIYDLKADPREGDRLIQEVPGGRQIAFRIIDVESSQQLHAIPAHFSLKLQKEGVPSERSARPTVNISHSTGIQVGDHNLMTVEACVSQIVEVIERSSAPAEQKTAVKSKLKEFLSSPVAAAVLGNVSAALLARL